jgi:hypothetical protein
MYEKGAVPPDTVKSMLPSFVDGSLVATVVADITIASGSVMVSVSEVAFKNVSVNTRVNSDAGRFINMMVVSTVPVMTSFVIMASVPVAMSPD